MGGWLWAHRLFPLSVKESVVFYAAWDNILSCMKIYTSFFFRSGLQMFRVISDQKRSFSLSNIPAQIMTQPPLLARNRCPFTRHWMSCSICDLNIEKIRRGPFMYPEREEDTGILCVYGAQKLLKKLLGGTFTFWWNTDCQWQEISQRNQYWNFWTYF